MTVAVSRAKGRGAEAVICASTGNTAASAAAYAARAGMRGAVIVPEGKIAIGKLAPGADARCPRHRPAGQLRRRAADRPRPCRPRTRSSSSTRSTRIGSRARRPPPSRSSRSSAGRPGALAIPVGNAGNITAYWRGFQEVGEAPVLYGFQAEGAAPLVHGAPVADPETVASAIRIGNPARWEEAMDALTASAGGSLRSATSRFSTPTAGLPPRKGCSASRPRRPLSPGCWPTACRSSRCPAPRRRSSARSPAMASRTPTRPSSKAPAVVNCRQRPRRGRARGLRVTSTSRDASSASPPPRQTSAPATTSLAAALSLHLELEVAETGGVLRRPRWAQTSRRVART